MSDLWTAAQAMKATGGVLAGDEWTATGITFDSREVAPGDLFVAIKGIRDGHDFVADAFEKGAVAALISDGCPGLEMDANRIAVPDTQEALEQLGVFRRANVDAKICAITGSAGKTGTKEALAHCLAPSGETHASVKSFNNYLGVPLTLARMPQDTEFGVFEVGMNHPGEIVALSKMVRPHVAIVTTVQPVHLEFFKSVEAIADAKGEIFAGMEPDGTAILNRDSVHFERLRSHAEKAGVETILAFGKHKEADLHLTDLALGPDASSVRATICGEAVTYKVGAPGRHLVMNSLAVMGAVKVMGADLALAGFEYAKLQAADGRGRRYSVELSGGALTVVDESYNANPASMRATIETLGASTPGPRGRRIAVLGDMLELGPNGPSFHAEIAEAINTSNIDMVFCSGPLMANLWDALPDIRRGLYGASSKDLVEAVKAECHGGDIVMIKGSLGSAMKPIVDTLVAQSKLAQNQSDEKE